MEALHGYFFGRRNTSQDTRNQQKPKDAASSLSQLVGPTNQNPQTLQVGYEQKQAIQPPEGPLRTNYNDQLLVLQEDLRKAQIERDTARSSEQRKDTYISALEKQNQTLISDKSSRPLPPIVPQRRKTTIDNRDLHEAQIVILDQQYQKATEDREKVLSSLTNDKTLTVSKNAELRAQLKDATAKRDKAYLELQTAKIPHDKRSHDRSEALQKEISLLQEQLRRVESHRNDALGALRSEKEKNNAKVMALQEHVRKATESTSELSHLKFKLSATQKDYASLLSQLQPRETLDPGDIITQFTSLNASIKDNCFTISSALLKRIFNSSSLLSNTLLGSAEVKKIRTLLPGASMLVQSPAGLGRPLDEFVEFALRHAINDLLYRELFSKFHPSLSYEESNRFREVYENIRHSDPQFLSAKWRTSTYLALSTTYSSETWSRNFEASLTSTILSLASLVSPLTPPSFLTPKMLKSLSSIASTAYKWNDQIKGHVTSQDFNPFVCDDSHEFNPLYMSAYGKHEVGLGGERVRVLAGVTLGVSSELGGGNGKEREIVVLAKAEVLTEGYFSEV